MRRNENPYLYCCDSSFWCNSRYSFRLNQSDNSRTIHREKPVHSEYETKMIERFAADIIEKVNSNLDTKKAHPRITGGQNAAASLIDLMKKSVAVSASRYR